MAPLKPKTVEEELERLNALGAISREDSPESRKEKLEALFALSDAAIGEGMETWTQDRILAEVARRRGTQK